MESQRDIPPVYIEPDTSQHKLPAEGKRNVLITSALPYVNNVPHLGNIIGSVLSADVFSRYCRIRGYNSLYICGTDEYGTATEMKAIAEGVSPQQICDKYHQIHKQIYDWFNIDFDHFGRTTTEHQTEIAQNIFLKIVENGFTSVDSQQQLHCGNCQKFLADRFVNGTCPHCQFNDARGDQCDGCGRLLDGVELVEPKCLICGSTPTEQQSRHVFLDLDRLSPQLECYLAEVVEAGDSHWSASAVAITRSWLKMGLEKRCITRDLKWGTPVPLEQFASKVFYVWFDAPIGYLSITKSLLGDHWTRWWKNPAQVELFHFLGKDNVAFHSIIFPATLLATGDKTFTRARHICATEYLNYEDQKFSKSRGVGVFGDAAAQTGIPADVFRFYLLYMRPEGQDTSFCWDDLMLKVNSELLANLGNFVLRALSFLFNSFGGLQPPIEAVGPVEEELFVAVDLELREYALAMEEVRFRDALQRVLAISRRGNQYMQAGQPWALVKSGHPEERSRAQTIIAVAANLSVLLSILLYPFMPAVSAQIREQCNLPPKNLLALPEKFIFFLKPGHKLNKPTPLFTKLEQSQVDQWKTLFAGAQSQQQSGLAAGVNGGGGADIGIGGPARKTAKKGQQQQNSGSSPSKRQKENMENSEGQMDELYGKVAKKFQRAKDLFVAEQMERFEAENKRLREQIEEQLKTLGYTDQLFAPPRPTLIKEQPKAAANVSETKIQKQNIIVDGQQKQPAAGAVPAEKAVAKKEKGGGDLKKGTTTTSNKKEGGDQTVDVGRLDLRVGRILDAKKHPDADALYVEQIDLGEAEPRTVVSGLVKFVPIDQMQNRLVVCLCNLKPAKMRGVESQAMVMCASTAEKVEVLELDPSSQPGDIVVCEQFPHRPDPVLNPKKKIWETVAPDLAVSGQGECVYKGSLLRVQRTGSTLRAATLRNVPVK